MIASSFLSLVCAFLLLPGLDAMLPEVEAPACAVVLMGDDDSKDEDTKDEDSKDEDTKDEDSPDGRVDDDEEEE